MEENYCVLLVEKLVRCTTDNLCYSYKHSSRINVQYCEAVVVVWRRYGKISRKVYKRLSKVIFRKILIRNTGHRIIQQGN
jgi:hypothetical protein